MTQAENSLSQSGARRVIRVLSDSLINKIAAGEVVERPASVVKELLENAIDAGATRVGIAVEEGGRTLIRISDNGSGIPAGEAQLAFAQHATSKIETTEDLFAISTMGFRGEALASIASVSHATMVTRTAGEAQGTRVEVKDSLVSAAVPCAAAVGTTLEIRDLFYSVPARRKFLRSDPTEFGHIHEMVLRSALPNPGLAVSLSHNGRMVLDLPATGDHLSRVSAALGEELHDQMLALDFEERGIGIRGFAGQPSIARGTAKYQYVFLNGRFIRDRSILHAVKEAYRGLIEPTSQPVVVLFITMDPMAFDVNVHPQKTEVRFRDSNAAYSKVLAAIRERLLGSDLTPRAKVEGRMEGSRECEMRDAKSEKGDGGIGSGGENIGETRRVIAEFFKQATPSQPGLAFGVEGGRSGGGSSFGGAGPMRVVDDLTIVHKVGAAEEEMAAASGDGGRCEMRDAKCEKGEAPDAGGAIGFGVVPAKFVQLHNTYLVAETGEGLVIIDQHALHERILYEELFTRVTRGALEGQRLLLPEILPVNPRQQAVLETVQPLLAELGIEVAGFDAQSIAVHSFPSLLSKVQPREFLRELLDKLLEMGTRLTREEMLHEVLDMASCKAAVKAGYPLSDEEIAALLARKEEVDRSSNCPHGRPTTLRLSISDLEHQFKRK